ncbi:MAG: hypothetical protein HY939_04245 [Gammaproteobacteria bacterium]|nr:hypothetical protein [Gammaproteobacteria bacterium]
MPQSITTTNPHRSGLLRAARNEAPEDERSHNGQGAELQKTGTSHSKLANEAKRQSLLASKKRNLSEEKEWEKNSDIAE